MRWNMRGDLGEEKRTKCEWWGTECLDQQDGCVVGGDCGHSKREMREWWRSTCLQLTLCNRKFCRHRVRFGM